MNSAERFQKYICNKSVRKNLKSKSVRGVVSTALGSGGDFILRLASISVLAHLIVPEHFGLFGMVTAITMVASQIVHLGLASATVQRKDIDHYLVSNLFWINAAFGLLLAVLLVASAPIIAHFFREPRLTLITILLATTFVWNGLAVQHEALMTRQMRQGQMALVRVGALVASAGLAIVMALQGWGYWALVWQEVARNALTSIGFWCCCRWRPSLPSRGPEMRSLLSFGWHLTVMQLLNAFVLNIDRVLLGRVFGAEPVGMYRQAQQLILVPTEQLNAPIQSVAQPALSMLQNDPERYRRYFRKIVFVIALITMPCAALGVVYAEEAVWLILGEKWMHAVVLFRIFAIWAFIRPVLGMAGVVLISLGQSKRLLHYSYLRYVVFLGLTCLGLKWGMVGVAVAQVGSTYLLLIPCLWYSFAKSPVSMGLFFRAISASLFASGLMVGGLFLFHACLPGLSLVPTLACGLVLAAVLYLGGCALFPEARREVLEFIQQALAARKRRASGVVDQPAQVS